MKIDFDQIYPPFYLHFTAGGESVGIVELAPNPKIPHDKLETSKERDFKCGTIETDHEYKKFMSERENPQKPDPISMEQLIKEIDEKEKMIEKNAVQETPLTQFMIKKSIRRIEEKKRSREEEKRERIERRYESELKDKQDRKDLKKVTEFRNSKFERSREGAMKEKERTKIRAYRSGDYNRNGTVEKSNKWSESNDRDNVHLSKKGTDPSASRDFLPKKAKQNGENQNLEVEKIDDSEKRKEARKDEAVTNKIIPNKQNIRVSKVINRTVAGKTASVEKNDKDLDKGKKEEKAENGSRPRRNKDRPERAIYQPSAVRRRAAALAASGAEKVASASKENP
uniref:UPF3 domain-containing protein n=1 Tax=Setaria digitata TaxID=48799 RepID=A0A915PTK7_9BILA